jgi:predicted nucleotide-binding protein (sugar kinase/HSP70/actin superfamily)
MNQPLHHQRYRRAWDLYQDESLSPAAKKILENEMDSAQKYFGWEEFQEFKKTLPGFIEHWDNLTKNMTQALKQMIGH